MNTSCIPTSIFSKKGYLIRILYSIDSSQNLCTVSLIFPLNILLLPSSYTLSGDTYHNAYLLLPSFLPRYQFRCGRLRSYRTLCDPIADLEAREDYLQARALDPEAYSSFEERNLYEFDVERLFSRDVNDLHERDLEQLWERSIDDHPDQLWQGNIDDLYERNFDDLYERDLDAETPTFTMTLTPTYTTSSPSAAMTSKRRKVERPAEPLCRNRLPTNLDSAAEQNPITMPDP
ncbi:hypothetical protein MMC30_007168 [Trapelia coarctata]|nr:hypothetical protein [Trapelia coarctata]